MKNFKLFITLFLLSAFVSAWAGEVTVTGETTEWTDGNTYNVTGDVTIDTRITVSGSVTLNLGAGATLTASKGIEVSEGNTLTIEGDGTLNATGDSYTKYYSNVSWSHNCGRAGIGAENVGTIIINSGNINATGGAGNGDDTHGAAGIGGSYNNTTGGSIIINGGVVNATGSERGAGIGGGNANGGGLPGSITINGGQVTANGGYGASGIGKGGSAGAGQATLTLGWTKMTDFIHASSIGSGNDFSSITFVEGKKFAYEGTETVVTASNIVEKDDNGKKIVPLITMTDLSNAVIGNVNTNYTYSGSEISITPAVSLDNNVLTGGEDYTVSYTKGGNSVTAVQEPGVYTLTVTGAGSLFHGSKSFVFSVQGSVNYQAYENGTLTDKPSLAADGYTTVVPSTTTMSAGWYVVSDNVTVSDRISVSGDVHLVLCDGATLTAQTGISVTDGNSLTIYSQSGNTGKLVATVPAGNETHYHAAIGGERYGNIHDAGTPVKAGSITIHGGDITATAYFSAAGIGKAYGGKAGDISIYGGKVTASCDGESGIGIGGDEAVIQLGYARTDDYIQSLGYIGSVTVASDRKFATDDATPVDISGSVINLSSINGKKLTPKTYTVSFSLGYDGGTAPDAQIVYHGLTKAIEPTAPTRTIYSFGGWKNGSTAYDFTAAVTSDLSLKAIWTPDPAHFSVNDAGTEYTIHTAEGWGVFCDILAENDKGYFDGKTVKLDADIGTAENPVTRMAGSLDHEFTGIFDGRGHTLTVNLTGTSDYTAPFVYVKSQDDDHPIIIRNLKVAGTITTAYKYAAGIAADCRGIVHIENSQSSVTINSSKSGDGTHGGLVGYNGSSLTITGSAFTGKLITTNGTTHCGGFVGWINTTTNIINSLYAPAALADGETEVGATESSTFGRKKKAAVTITNSYYTRSFGTEQGLASRTITADEGVTIDAVAPVGDATETYTVSSITAYANGITCGGKFYYGNGDQVSLTLSHEDPAGYSISGYTASAGTLSSNDKSYLLAMPENGDVTISRSLAKLLTNSDISISAIDDQTYIGSEICPEITVTDGKASLELNTDYTVECSDNVNAGTATMAITGAGNYAGSVAKMFEIAQAPVTVSGVNAANKVYDGTTSATIAGTAIVSGVLGNDDVGVEYGTAVFADANVGEGIAVAFSGFTLTGADKGNYYLSNQPASVAANITKAPLTVTAKNKIIAYGDDPANDGVEYDGFVGEENESVLGGKLTYSYNYKKLDKVGKYTITPSGLTADNYDITFVAGTLTVELKKLTVTALPDTITYGDEVPSEFNVEYSGFVDNETEDVLKGSLSNSCEYTQYGDAGKYAITPSGLTADNYEIEFVAGKLAVLPKVLIVRALNKTIAYGDEPSNAGVEYDGFAGEENEKSLSGELDFTYDGYKQYGDVGEYDIMPNGLSAKNYKVKFVAGKLTVEPKTVLASGAVQVLEDQDGRYAEIDGNYGEAGEINITQDITVNSVSFNREFSYGNGYSTVVFPFEVNTSRMTGVDSVLVFAKMVKDKNGNLAVGMRVVWSKDKKPVVLAANVPYMLKMNASTIDITDEVILKQTKEPVTPSEVSDGWEFRGTYKYKQWSEGDEDVCRVYGYAATSTEDVSAGEFVKFIAGARIRPLRAYLINTNKTCATSPKNAPLPASADGGYAVKNAMTPDDVLPEHLNVVIIGDDEEHTTVIGRINTRTGEFTSVGSGKRFDLKGRPVRGNSNAHGAYYNKNLKK